MKVIFYLSDDFKWTKGVKRKLFKYLHDYLPNDKKEIIKMVIESEKHFLELKKFLVYFRSCNNRLYIRVENYPRLSPDYELDFDFFIKETYLVVIDYKRKREVTSYIPCTYTGVFKYI